MSYHTPLSFIDKLGSAKSGTSHHIAQRVTAVFLVPLMFWFIYVLYAITVYPREMLAWTLTSPVVVIGSVLFLLVFMHHATLGLQMVIEDYISCPVKKKIMLILMLGFNITTTVAGIIAIFTIHILSRVV